MLENRDPDESYYETLKQVFIKNAKYLLPSSQCDSKEDKSETDSCGNSNEIFKVFDDIRGNFEDTNINHTRSDQLNETSEDPGNAKTSSTSSSPQLLEIVKLSPSTKEEFIEFCRHKCTCFRNSELRLSENPNNNLVTRDKRDNIVENRNHDSTFFDNLEISLNDQTREIFQTSPSSEHSENPNSDTSNSGGSEKETSSTQCFNLKSSESHETSADTIDDTVSSASKQSNKRKLEIPVKCDKSSKRFCDMDEKSREENSPKTEFVGDSSFENSLSNECKSEKSNECKSEKSNECKCKSESSNECKPEKSNHSLSEEEVFAVYPDHLIRAFTHTDVIALVRDKLLEEIRNGQSVYNRHLRRDVD